LSNIIIKPEHQSAPKAHWADAEIMKAAVEIDAGRFIPDPDGHEEGREQMEAMGLALGGTQGQKPSLEDFRRTHEQLAATDLLARHPRVIEAMERMRQEIDTAPLHEAIEKTCMLREMATAQTQGKVVDEQQQRRIDSGQAPEPHDQRWQEQTKLATSKDEASRRGTVLTPQQFYDRLRKVTGRDHLKLSHHAVLPHPGAKSGRVGLYVRNPAWQGEVQIVDDRQARAQQLQAEGETHLLRARRLRRIQQHADADKAFTLAGDMAQAATEILITLSAEEQARPPEMLRVASLQWPCGTEWMVCGFNEFGVVTHAKYLGWRTALLTMIRNGTITEKQAHKAFPVGSGPAADWYLEQLRTYRALTGTVQ
jgi:hypothetical protein